MNLTTNNWCVVVCDAGVPSPTAAATKNSTHHARDFPPRIESPLFFAAGAPAATYLRTHCANCVERAAFLPPNQWHMQGHGPPRRGRSHTLVRHSTSRPLVRLHRPLPYHTIRTVRGANTAAVPSETRGAAGQRFETVSCGCMPAPAGSCCCGVHVGRSLQPSAQ